MKINQIPPNERVFREEVVNFWASYKDHRQCLTFGFFLHIVKKSLLWKDWGHKSFYWYCRNELHLVPVGFEQMYIVGYLRLERLGFSPDQMVSLERKYSFNRIIFASKIAGNEREFTKIVEDGVKKQVIFKRGYKTININPIRVPAVGLMKMAHEKIAAHYGCTKDEAVLVSAIVNLCVIHKKETDIAKITKRLCREAKLSMDIAEKISGEI